MKKILILGLFLLVSCQNSNSNSEVEQEVSPSGSHLGGVQGGGTEADRQPVESGTGHSSK